MDTMPKFLDVHPLKGFEEETLKKQHGIRQTKYDISAAVTLKTLMKMQRDYACPAHQLCMTVFSCPHISTLRYFEDIKQRNNII